VAGSCAAVLCAACMSTRVRQRRRARVAGEPRPDPRGDPKARVGVEKGVLPFPLQMTPRQVGVTVRPMAKRKRYKPRPRVWYRHHGTAELDGRIWNVRCLTSCKELRIIATFHFGEPIEQSAVKELNLVCAANHEWVR
jgi:hypothetical protein